MLSDTVSSGAEPLKPGDNGFGASSEFVASSAQDAPLGSTAGADEGNDYQEEAGEESGPVDQWLLRARHGSLRAILSERYSPLDNPELLKCLAPFWQEHFRVDWFALGDESLHLRVIDPALVMEGLPQDDLMAGVHISNSEVGKRAVTVDAMVFRLVCSNGLIRQVKGKSLLRQRHIHITHKRFHEQFEGAVREGMNIAAGFMSQLALTARQPVQDVEETLKRLGERWHLGQGVQEMALHAMRQEARTVQETVYGLVNGLTRAAQDLSMDHRYDLEVLAGHLAEHGLPSWARPTASPRPAPMVRMLPSAVLPAVSTAPLSTVPPSASAPPAFSAPLPPTETGDATLPSHRNAIMEKATVAEESLPQEQKSDAVALTKGIFGAEVVSA